MGRPKPRKSRFNLPVGRNSRKYKRRQRKLALRVEKCVTEDNNFHYQPYQLTRKFSVIHGQPSLRFVVRRININKRKLKVHHFSAKPTQISITAQEYPEPDGYRIINTFNLHQYMVSVISHSAVCSEARKLVTAGKTSVSLLRETSRTGFCSSLELSCQGCGTSFTLNTSTKAPDSSVHDINMRVVWGSMVTGGGVAATNEMMATMGVPGMRQAQYTAIEQQIGDMWHSILKQDMLEAGAEERRLAIERKDFHQGVPAISVICDGGWSKRSHKHTYNAFGGVAVIFGAATGKLLHIGIRNKHCYICSAAESRHSEPQPHQCFRNWNDSSQAMEADVIIEGFCSSEKVHGVRYMRLIADGDSSVYARIQQEVPVWGAEVVKLECANHACKCLRTSLEKLVDSNPHYKGHGNLTKQQRIRLTKGVRCAIRMRSEESNRAVAVRRLEHDIRNCVHHVFGDHSQCSDFCKKRPDTSTAVPAPSEGDSVSDSIPSVLDAQQNMWQEVTCEDDLEESRFRCHNSGKVDPQLLRDVSVLLDRIARKSSRLIGNFTTNLAESWMSIRSKFDGGKLYNRCNRGSWHSRCYGGALRKNFGPAWSPVVWHKFTGLKPGSAFTQHYQQRARDLLYSQNSKKRPDVRARAVKRKLEQAAQSNSKKAKRNYGPEATQVIPDISAAELGRKCQDYLATHINLTNEQLAKVESLTRDQSLSVTWMEERKKRLTASRFGDIVKRKPTIDVHPLVTDLLYKPFLGSRYTNYGLGQESITIKEYIQRKQQDGVTIKVSSVGFVIDNRHKFLGASPDGKVQEGTNVGLVEVKNLLQRNQMSFEEAARKGSFCLAIKNGKVQLKRNHNYYYQCQGQLNVLQYPWVDFVVRRTNPYQLHIERIYRDDDLWRDVMVPKLEAFYLKAYLPELASPRHHTSTGIREPEKPWFVPADSVRSRQTSKATRNRKGAKQPSSQTTDSTHKTATDSRSRPTRRRRCKFVGRRIRHKWTTDEAGGETKWYEGTVLECVEGRDGQDGAVYEVKYKGETEKYLVDHLQEDLDNGSLKFKDL